MKRILVVDDEPSIAEICRRALGAAGYEVETASDGREALDLAMRAQGAYGMVLTDVTMPRMDGVELLGLLKRRFPKTDVVMMTGFPELETAVETLKQGAYDYLTKPLDLDLLLACVHRCWEKRELSEALNAEVSLRNELEAAYRELQRAETAKEAFLACVGHELRTPLSIVLGTLDLIARSPQDEGALGQHLDRMRLATRRLHDVIEDLLAYSDMRQAGFELKRRPLDLRPFLEEILSLCRGVMEKKGVSWRADWAQDLPMVSADPERLGLAFKHLVLNATHFNKEGGQVLIEARREGASVHLLFTDTGIGIPPEVMPNLFSGFYQAAEYLTRTVGGLGLGLAIVKGVVCAHGGTVWVQSSVGKGTTFTVVLPLAGSEDS